MVIIPLALNAADSAVAASEYLAVATMATYSLFPLLFTPAEYPIKVPLTTPPDMPDLLASWVHTLSLILCSHTLQMGSCCYNTAVLRHACMCVQSFDAASPVEAVCLH